MHMRYKNAPHIIEEAIYARRPVLGFVFQLIGLFVLVATVSCTQAVAVLMGISLFLWLLAWYAAVGSIWRSTLTAALLLQAVLLSCSKGCVL